MTTRRYPLYFTLSDGDFSPRTLAMIKSLRAFDENARFIFFHFDDLNVNQLEIFRKSKVDLYSIRSFLGNHLFDSLASSREYLELLWTLPSVIAKELLISAVGSERTDVVYLDADLFFFGSPKEIWKEVPLNQISIVRHNFSARLRVNFPQSGEFNVSWVSFPVTGIGVECASEWAANCTELCPATPTMLNGRLVYGDQLYLEDWPSRFKGSIHVIENIGVGVAPWNYENYEITEVAPILVNTVPVIFFHFSSHQYGFLFARKMGSVYSAVSPIPAEIYRIYERAISEACRDLGFNNWKSRFQPIHIRVYRNLMRRFKGSK
jgi:hypothetical protein